MQWLRNTAYILIVLLGGGFILLQGKGLLFPFLFAVFFAFLLMPLEKWIYRRIPQKVVSITGSVVFVLAVIGGSLFVFGYQLIEIFSEMNAIQDQLKNGIQQVMVFLDQNIPYLEMPADPQSMDEMMSKLI